MMAPEATPLLPCVSWWPYAMGAASLMVTLTNAIVYFIGARRRVTRTEFEAIEKKYRDCEARHEALRRDLDHERAERRREMDAYRRDGEIRDRELAGANRQIVSLNAEIVRMLMAAQAKGNPSA